LQKPTGPWPLLSLPPGLFPRVHFSFNIC
jgi:hypothetical protein